MVSHSDHESELVVGDCDWPSMIGLLVGEKLLAICD